MAVENNEILNFVFVFKIQKEFNKLIKENK